MRKRIAFYCQNLLGVGHVTRSLAIVDALAEEFEVTFIQGGEEIGRVPSSPQVNRILLPPLMMRETDSSLYVPGETRSVQEQWEARGTVLDAMAEEPFDALIVELFPFGRRKFRNEIFRLQDRMRLRNPQIPTFCSLRDIMIQPLSETKRATEIAEFVRERFSLVLVHSDPALLPLERTWPAAEQIRDRLAYTGFVSERKVLSPGGTEERRQDIIVSAGGGNVGLDLYEAVAECAPDFPSYRFVFVLGPYMEPSRREAFARRVRALPNAECTEFLPDFERRLGQCSLSISLAGYNTTMNVLRSRTPALLYPYQANWEQATRVAVLAERGCFLPVSGLDRASMQKSIQAGLLFQPRTLSVDLEGANQSLEIVREWLAKGGRA